MPDPRAGQGVSELMCCGGDRELTAASRIGWWNHRGGVRSTMRVAPRRGDPNRRSGPPGAFHDHRDGGRDFVEGPDGVEVGAAECSDFRCVHLGASAIVGHPGPNDRRPSTRRRPRSARSAAALPASNRRPRRRQNSERCEPSRTVTDEPIDPLDPRQFCRRPLATITRKRHGSGNLCGARGPHRRTWRHGRRNRRGTNVEIAGSPPESNDAPSPSVQPPAHAARCT